MGAELTYVDLAYGDATNKKIITRSMMTSLTTEIVGVPIAENLDYSACYYPLPAGTELWVRGRCSTAPTSGYSAVAIGIGG
jgi:hypothetical protein